MQTCSRNLGLVSTVDPHGLLEKSTLTERTLPHSGLPKSQSPNSGNRGVFVFEEACATTKWPQYRQSDNGGVRVLVLTFQLWSLHYPLRNHTHPSGQAFIYMGGCDLWVPLFHWGFGGGGRWAHLKFLTAY